MIVKTGCETDGALDSTIHNLHNCTMCVQLGQIRSIHRNKDAGVVSFSSSLLASVGELSSQRREIFLIYAENIFESRKYFSGACVRNFTLLVLYTETAAERRDPVGLSICSLMSVCGLVLTYQVDTATSVDNIYLLFVIISTGLYLQLPRPGGHEQDETRVDSYPIWLLSVINC